MRKLPESLENPIDNIIYNIIDKIAPFFHAMKFTPNMITTLGNICTLIFAYFIFNYRFKLAAFFFGLSYLFDCLDGYLARKYNMVTEFGDLYDHLSDTLKTLVLFYALYIINKKLLYKIIPFIVILFILVCIHMANQETFYNKPQSSKTLQMLHLFSFSNKETVEEHLKYSRYFGCGTLTLLLTCIIFFYKKQ